MTDPQFKSGALELATLDWKEGGTPVSRRFGDVYFSAEDGLAESRHVFLDGCGLPEAWQGASLFCVGETGFGTGLNFLATWEAWRRTKAPGARLHYVSVEGYPLSREDLKKCLLPWKELQHLSTKLCAAYPDPHGGFHRLHLEDGVTLTLLMGEVGLMLNELEGAFDAWFLDGFAPAQNSDMWRPEIIAEIARLSKPGARLATFTVAGAVRRSLQEHGFDVEKAPGFGRKRDMCRARFQGSIKSASKKPWFDMPHAFGGERKAAVLGGGIAGTSVAAALKRRGFEVTLLERHKSLAQEASGNPIGLVMPRLAMQPNFEARLYTEAFRYAVQEFQSLEQQGISTGYQAHGLLRLQYEAEDKRRFRSMMESALLPSSQMQLVTAEEASLLAGISLQQEALYFPGGGSVDPSALCHVLVEGVDVVTAVEAETFYKQGKHWQVDDARGVPLSETPLLILAGGVDAARHAPLSWVPLKAFRGQISLVPADSQSAPLKTALVFGSYILPAQEGWHCIGATYDKMPSLNTRPRQSVRKGDHKKNIENVRESLPDFFAGLSDEGLRGRAALRCTTPDFQPVVGPVPDEAAYRHIYDGLRLGQRGPFPSAHYHEGLYAHVALGSRGLTTALLSAELLVSQMCGEPWPVERSLAQTLHPGRFLIRQIKRAAL